MEAEVQRFMLISLKSKELISDEAEDQTQDSQDGINWKGLMALLEKAMEPHSSILAWKIPWMEEPGRLQSMRLLRVGHD